MSDLKISPYKFGITMTSKLEGSLTIWNCRDKRILTNHGTESILVYKWTKRKLTDWHSFEFLHVLFHFHKSQTSISMELNWKNDKGHIQASQCWASRQQQSLHFLKLTLRQVVSRYISLYLISLFFSAASRQHCRKRPSERRLKNGAKEVNQLEVFRSSEMITYNE